jgi:hypothetical protein
MFDEEDELYVAYNTPKSLGSAIAAMLRANPKFAAEYTLAVAKNIWLNSSSQPIIHATGDIYLRGATLFIQITNPSLRANLNTMRQTICQQLNEQIVAVKLREVKFV